jgi:hypothetical protein
MKKKTNTSASMSLLPVRCRFIALFLLAAFAGSAGAQTYSPSWSRLGPAPIPNGQTANNTSQPVSGRVTAIVVHPTNADIAYVGTAQGGVYRT